jgi:long-chain acyl-CoA synthetase
MRDNTLVKMVDNRADRYGDRTVLERKVNGTWESISWDYLARTYREVGRGLLCLGLEGGDRVAILSENRPEWAFADLGTLSMDGVVVPLYWTLTPAQLEYILRDCAAKAIFVSNVEYEGVMTFDELITRGCEADPEMWEAMGRSIAEGSGDDLATIIYTSGTTGEPKGVMLTHDNFLSNIRSVLKVIEIKESDVCLSFLPLSHVFERVAYYLFLFVGGRIAYAESIDHLMANMAEVQPTILISVPRIYEKAYGRILDRVRESSSVKRLIFYSSLNVGRKVSVRLLAGEQLGGWLRFRRRIADQLVFSKLRQNFGGRIRLMISGGAPLSKQIGEFFYAAGLLILEGYGLTETSPIISANQVEKVRFGTVGLVVPDVEVRIAEDGEIQVRGPNVMKGYYNLPQDTAEAIDGEGWFSTGDIGHIDQDDFLVITDRKKAMIVTAGGNALSTDKFINQAFTYGDRRKYITALITLDWERIENYAREHKIEFSSHADLCKNEAINELIRKRVDSALKDFSPFEQVKKFKILEKEFSQEEGEVTPETQAQGDHVPVLQGS